MASRKLDGPWTIAYRTEELWDRYLRSEGFEASRRANSLDAANQCNGPSTERVMPPKVFQGPSPVPLVNLTSRGVPRGVLATHLAWAVLLSQIHLGLRDRLSPGSGDTARTWIKLFRYASARLLSQRHSLYEERHRSTRSRDVADLWAATLSDDRNLLVRSIHNITDDLDETEHRYFDLVQLGYSTEEIALSNGVEHKHVLDVLTNARDRLGLSRFPQDAEGELG